MRTAKRFLCIVISLIIITSVASASGVYDMQTDEFIDDIFRFDVGEFVQGTETGVEDIDVKRIEFLNTIGLWDDTSKPKNALITMSEFATIMSKIKLGGDNAFVGVYEKNNDTSNVTYGYVLDGLLQVLGYDYRYQQYGNDDKATLIVAADIGLISDEAQNINSFVNRNTLAKLIERAINIDICVTEYTDRGYSYLVARGKTILNSVHNIHNMSGYVNAIPGLSVYGGSKLRDGYFEIDRTIVNSQGTDITEFFGTNVKAYASFDENSSEYKLMYISPDRVKEELVINFKDIVEINGNTIVYTNEEEEELEISVDGYKHIVENGTKLTSLSQMSDYRYNEGKIIFADSQGGSDFDTAVIFKYEYFVTDYIDTYQQMIGIKFGMKHNDESYIPIKNTGIKRIVIDGKPADYTSIKVNQAIRVLTCEATDYLEVIVSGDKLVEGTISSIYEDVIEVNNQKYRLSKNLTERITECKTSNEPAYNKVIMPELGVNIKLFVYGDTIVGFLANSGFMYAYLKDVKLSRTSIDPDITLRLYTQNGEWIDAPFADRVVIDTVAGYSKTKIQEFFSRNSSTVMGQLVRVKLSGQNKIIELDTIIESGAEQETLDDLIHAPDYEGGKVTAKPGFHKWEIGTERYKFDKATPVFVVPEDKSKEDKYRAVNPSALGAVKYDMICYSPNEFLHLGAVVVIGDLEGTSGKSDPAVMYVENMRSIVIDAENYEYGYRVNGTLFVESSTPGVGACKDVSYTISEERYDKAVKDGNAFVVGDIIRLDSVVKNEIIVWSFFEQIDRGSAEITGTKNVYELGTINGVENKRVYVGEVKRVDEANVLLLLDCGEGGDIVVKPRAKGIIDVAGKSVTNIEIGDFHEGDLVFAEGTGYHVQTIYKTINAD